MRPVRRDELVDYATWTEEREQALPGILEAKRCRRVHLGGVLTLLFENRDTVRYQVQEMMRVERIVKEAEIQHELATYNELLGREGELGCTLLIEIEDPKERDRKLTEWIDLPRKLFLVTEDGERVPATFDPRQIGQDKLSSVQFLRFAVRGRVPVAVAAELPGLKAEARLDAEQRTALAADLAAD